MLSLSTENHIRQIYQTGIKENMSEKERISPKHIIRFITKALKREDDLFADTDTGNVENKCRLHIFPFRTSILYKFCYELYVLL